MEDDAFSEHYENNIELTHSMVEKMGVKPMVILNRDREVSVMNPVDSAVASFQMLTPAQQEQFMIRVHCPELTSVEWQWLNHGTSEYFRRYQIIRKHCTRVDLGKSAMVLERVVTNPISSNKLAKAFQTNPKAVGVMFMDDRGGVGGPLIPFMILLDHVLRHNDFWNDLNDWLHYKPGNRIQRV